MKYLSSWRLAAASLLGMTLLALSLFVSKPAATQDTADKKFCFGCSVDGKTTPRTADGHPDLSGMWGGRGAAPAAAPAAGGAAVAPAAAAGGGGRGGQTIQKYSDGSIVFDFGTEFNDVDGVGRFCAAGDQSCQAPNQPPYNAEYMKKVTRIAKTSFGGSTSLDPTQECRAAGVPRAGAPNYIMQSPEVIVFLYAAAPYSTYRMIYMDGRSHPDVKTYETTYFGDSNGHWEGDTLVVDTVGFNDDTWLGGGTFGGANQFTSVHSEKEHAVERLTRNGNDMTYDVTVEDPEALTKPWVLNTRTVRHVGPGLEVPGEDALTENICTPTAEHLVLPNPEDQDIKNKCGYRCDGHFVLPGQDVKNK